MDDKLIEKAEKRIALLRKFKRIKESLLEVIIEVIKDDLKHVNDIHSIQFSDTVQEYRELKRKCNR